MADLKFIMDVDDDQPGPLPSRQGHDREPYSNAPSSSSSSVILAALDASIPDQAYGGHVSNPSAQSQITGSSSSPVKSIAPTPGILPAPSSGGTGARRPPNRATTSRTQSSSRRQSTASNDSMDQSGYGSAASSSSRGGGVHSSHSPMRPLSGPTPGDPPTRYTPITGRISRARKGVAVHTCEMCIPSKTFTRAEHLRRHQLSHGTPGYPCTYPDCGRSFHRPDLLLRHQVKSGHEDDRPGGKTQEYHGSESQRQHPVPRTPTVPHELSPQTTSSSVLYPDPGSSVRNDERAPPSATPSTPTPTAPYQGPPSQANTDTSPNLIHSVPGYGQSTSGYAPAFGPQYSSHHADSNTQSISTPPVTAPSMSAGVGNHAGYPHPRINVIDVFQQPRRSPPSVFVTQGVSLPSLSIPDNSPIPDLCHQGTDASPWTSSASDSTFSTPASAHARNSQFWLGHHLSPNSTDWPPNSHLSPFPNPTASRYAYNAPRENSEPVSAPGSAMSSSTFTPTRFVGRPQQSRDFENLVGVPMAGFESPLDMGSQGPANPATGGNHQQGQLAGAHLALTGPLQGSGTLVTPIMSLPTRPSPLELLGPQKDLFADGQDHNQWNVDFNVLGGLGGGFEDMDAEPGNDTGLLTGLYLPMTGSGYDVPPVVAPIMQLSRTTLAAVPGYIEIYWKHFYPLYPIVHRSTFEGLADPSVLAHAMAAVATQYLHTREDRVRGDQLHEHASRVLQESERITQWSAQENLQHMQAVLLCELYTRFRGRRAVTKPSTMFQALYSRSQVLSPANGMLDRPAHPKDDPAHMERQWRAWVDTEMKRRLLTACFIINVQTSAYQQQKRVKDGGAAVASAIRLTGQSAKLWEATSAAHWASVLALDPGAANPACPPSPDGLTPEDIQALPQFDQAAILAMELLRLPHLFNSTYASTDAMVVETRPEVFTFLSTPCRIQHLFPSSPTAATYLALHHTPLHDLLAVSGETFLFTHKVVPASSFLDRQRRLQTWATEPQSTAAQAVIHASRAILLFLERHSQSTTAASWMEEISDYWALYVCALIIWAFGHYRVQQAGLQTRGDELGKEEMSEEAALGWLRNVSSMMPEQVVRIRGRREAGGVVGLIRRRLEEDCLGVRSRLYADAVRVLKRLEEGADWNWF